MEMTSSSSARSGRAKDYDPGYEPPTWWLDAFFERVETRSQAEWARLASEAVSREPAWDASRIAKYKKADNNGRTLRLCIGLSHAMGITPPVFEAADQHEAAALMACIALHRGKMGTEGAAIRGTDRSRERRAELIGALDDVRNASETLANDQSVKIPSTDAAKVESARRTAQGRRGDSRRSARANRRG
jgi:hypothetical protein